MARFVRPPIIRDYEDRYQRDARAAIRQLDTPESRKTTIRNVVLGTTTVNVSHQLGHAPTSWVVINKNAQADVWRDPAGTITVDTIPLKASATVTVDLQFWI